jgi:DNA-binding transcriptional ArsR family regulator
MAAQTISKDTPLNEITLRKYEKPFNLEERELVRKLCLSTGLLQPGDSRDIVVDIFHVLLTAKREKKELTSEDIRELAIQARKNANLTLLGVASSNIRRQLKRLRDIFLVEKVRNRYRVTEFSSLNDIFEEKVEQYLLQSVLARLREYIRTVDSKF